MVARPSPARVASTANVLPALVGGGFVEFDGEIYYKISGYHRLAPFLMTVPGDTDLWMFVASGGGLTAGRVDPDGSLFPYRTVDQLHEAHHHTGPRTLVRIQLPNGEHTVWEPFAEANANDALVERSLYKNSVGNRLVFEEIHQELGLAFRYSWSACDEFGWVRSATLTNQRDGDVALEILDGLRNIIPFGAPLILYQQSSNLVDAYKHSEIDLETGLGIFSLSSSITDKAEALEILRANVVWCSGLSDCRVHLSEAAMNAFASGGPLEESTKTRGVRGHYFVTAKLRLPAGDSRRWHLVGDTRLDHVQIGELRRKIRDEEDLPSRIEEALREATSELSRNVASADGIQVSNDDASWCHHFANVLYNNMRGGVFLENHSLPVDDFRNFLRERNRPVADGQQGTLSRLPAMTTIAELRAVAQSTEDPDFERLSYEYLPLWFGRRHGDPSRPWNHFTIHTRGPVGERQLHYQGNWRDIFQNWEALGVSFPGFLPGMVAKFVNASTVDGFNPYRITRSGVDWETAAPDEPWSNIGYWGDHQIIYLLKLLETMDRYDPSAFGQMLGREIFSYAEVPYRIAAYERLVVDSRHTIDFDTELEREIEERVLEIGSDGKLLQAADGSVYHANLLEKLLVPLLGKLSNLVPDGGIWMNTQRPEWNDANNALAGPGLSVVTLCYLRRYLEFVGQRLVPFAGASLPVSEEVVAWFDRVSSALQRAQAVRRSTGYAATDRRALLDELGRAFSAYRESVYAEGFSAKLEISVRRVIEFFGLALEVVDRGIAANRREDGLFHSYNLLELPDDERAEIERLQEMLEGQVAVLSSGHLDPPQALELIERLYRSDLYLPAQRSFLLYPEEQIPGFLERNRLPEPLVEEIPLMMDLLASGNRAIVARDADGICRFHGDFQSAEDLSDALDALGESTQWGAAVARDREAVLASFEAVFRHRSFTGRSGVMFAYEGLGCIYWHMVAKLLVAVQENVWRAEALGASAEITGGLIRMYYRVRAGIGYEKSVAEYGAFPTDPYSHTPPHGGAKQPGMTGQVKEEILTRLGEFGVRVEEGVTSFRPRLLRASEFLQRPETFVYFDVGGDKRSVALPPGTLAFTFCQVPVVYRRGDGPAWIEIAFADGSVERLDGDSLDANQSAELFSRDGWIDRIEVGIPAGRLLDN